MTVSTVQYEVSYTGNGVTTAFAVPYPFFGEDELIVTERVIATGVETVKVLNTDYTVTGGDGSTGTVTAAAAPAGTKQWIITRSTKRTQLTDYQSNDPFPAESHEDALDRLAMVNIEQDAGQADLLSRAIQIPEGETTDVILPAADDRALKAVIFDADGNVTVSADNYEDQAAAAAASAAAAAGSAS